jgi:hypothetical protein
MRPEKVQADLWSFTNTENRRGINMNNMTIDLHGHPVWEAVELATEKIKEAWEQGRTHVTFIHGAPDIRHWQTASVLGRGGIKWQLRGHLASGAWMPYAYNRRSSKHFIGDGSMTLALRSRTEASD